MVLGGLLGASRERVMRKLWAFGLFSLGVATVICAAQRGAMAPSVAGPAVHAAPAAPAVGAHAAAPAHGAVASHGAPTRTGTHSGAPGARVVTSRKTTGNPMQPHPPNSGGNFSNRNFHPFYPYPTNLLPGVSDNFASGYPVPGLGFDYAHFFAVHPNWGRLHPVDGVLLSWGGGGGFYMPVPYYTESTPQEEEEQVVSNPQPVSNQQVVAEEPAAPPRARSGSYLSAEPVPEFVFVKHDGSTFSAVAYSWTKDKLQYVTKDGLRHSTGIDTLDLPATERMNEERGNSVNFPKSLRSNVALSIEPAPLN